MFVIRNTIRASLLAVAFFASADLATAASHTAEKLAHTWYYFDGAMMMDRALPTITLSNGKVTGSDSCNTLIGSYKVIGKRAIRFTIASTKKRCEDMFYVAPFHNGMNAARSYDVMGDILILRDRKGKQVLQMKRLNM